jgi:hypothetical protein
MELSHTQKILLIGAAVLGLAVGAAGIAGAATSGSSGSGTGSTNAPAAYGSNGNSTMPHHSCPHMSGGSGSGQTQNPSSGYAPPANSGSGYNTNT